MIVAEHLHKRFAGIHAVNDVSLRCEKGKIFGLLGPNGAGKSTTIRMITNILEPDGGSISYDGQPFSDAIRNRVGYLPEERGLYQKARIQETIVHLARMKGLDESTAKKRSSEWLRRFDLAGSEKRKIEELSKGNQQKIQLTIALIHEPEYIILDEPASGLDPVNQELLRDIVEQMRSEGKTILYSTHQMELAERLCDQIILINKGKAVLSGTVDEVRAKHGGNYARVDFTGDGAYLRNLPIVVEGDIFANYAELKLQPNATLNDLLPNLTDRLRVSRVEQTRPTLNAIFIETVGHANLPPEMQTKSNHAGNARTEVAQ